MHIGLLIQYIAGIILSAALLCLVTVGYVEYATHGYIYGAVDALPQTQTAMVLGASIGGNGMLSRVLQERADKAVELYRAGKVSKILVSGDDGTLSYNEVDPVGRYLGIRHVQQHVSRA
jgi:vancomycin permeability regulator SanA